MKRPAVLFLALLWFAFLVAADSTVQPAADFGRFLDRFASAKGAESSRLQELFDAYWRFQMTDSPEYATSLGYPGQNGHWSDLSPEAMAARRALPPKMVAAIQSIDRARLAPRERVDYDLFRGSARREVEGLRFPEELLPINQMGGVQQDVPKLLELAPAASLADYEDILSRLRGVPRLVDQTIALLERGLAAGVTPPRIALRDVPAQVADLLVHDDPVAKSPLLTAFRTFPATVPAAEQERLRGQALELFRSGVVPAFQKLHDFLVHTYLPGSRESIAMSALPDGAAWYAFNVRRATTTDLTPQEIHQLGLSEVKRIREEMDGVIRQTDFKGSFPEFLHFLRTDPRFFYDRPEDLLAGYRDIAKRIDPELVRLFGRLPRLTYGVIPVPSYSERSQTTAYYDGGSLAAGRAGHMFANTYDLKSRPKWEMEALTLHEAVPGHHLQIALAQELPDVPEWRRHDDYTAFSEGWGLYAESLGGEIGLYKDPFSRFGQLTYEMWRAVRLVVDTGMHTLGWTRQQAIDYFQANAPKAEHDIVVEIDRYIVWPGQALAYKIGGRKFQELRAYAERELGAAFDVRAFHDNVLGQGGLPLGILESNVKAWVAERKQQAAGAESRPAAAGRPPL